MQDWVPAIKCAFGEELLFIEHCSGLALREYQKDVVEAVIDSVRHRRGLSFVVIFPRQSGKNELQAQIETFLLLLYSNLPAEIVKVSPTWKPQSLNAMRRLERVLEGNPVSLGLSWTKEQGYIYRLDKARIYFLSGQPSANIVGATANLLLECDEAQDVAIAKWDKEINPMAASTNATRVFWGTAWTSATLLAREKHLALEAQREDGIRRVFEIDAEVVGAEHPPYLEHVAAEVRKLGRSHPSVRTQYYSEEIDAQSSMFPPSRQALMRGEHPPLNAPGPPYSPNPVSRPYSEKTGHNHHAGFGPYAFLIDVAGEDESADLDAALGSDTQHASRMRDSTALTVVQVDSSTVSDDLVRAPRYLVRARKLWTGVRHSTLYGRIKALVELWRPRYLVIDATGVGAGLASFLEKAFPGMVIPFLFNSASKSKLGWDFIAVIETGRFKDYRIPIPEFETGSELPAPGVGKGAGGEGSLQALFWREVDHCQMEIASAPNRTMKWGVPDGARDSVTGDLVHDDLLVSAALCVLLDSMQWGTANSAVIEYDPLEGMGEVW